MSQSRAALLCHMVVACALAGHSHGPSTPRPQLRGGFILRLRGGGSGAGDGDGKPPSCSLQEPWAPLTNATIIPRASFKVETALPAHGPVPANLSSGGVEADWRSRGGRTYNEVSMMGNKNGHRRQTFSTFFSPLGKESSADDATLKSPQRQAYEAMLRKLQSFRASLTDEVEGVSVSKGCATVFSTKGRRDYQEDTFAISESWQGLNAEGDREVSLFAMFDGHGGVNVSNYCKEHFINRVFEFLIGAEGVPAGVARKSARAGAYYNKCWEEEGRGGGGGGGAVWESESDHERVGKTPIGDVSLEQMQRAMQYAFSATDREVMNCGLVDGATSVCLSVSRTHLLVSNVGDSRAVLYEKREGKRRGFEAVALSNDHKPSRKDEMERIEALGGHITNLGVPRVNGVLAISRAIGDVDYKRFLISDPEFKSIRRRAGQCFVVLATDGVWDVMTRKEVCELICAHWGDIGHGAEACTQEAYRRGSCDNITVMVVDLESELLPTLSEERQRQDGQNESEELQPESSASVRGDADGYTAYDLLSAQE